MVFYLDFGSLRYPTEYHKILKEQFKEDFETIRTYKSSLMLILYELNKVYYAKKAVHTDFKLVGDLMRVSEECFNQIVHFYKNDLRIKEALTLEHVIINGCTVYYLCISKMHIGGQPTYFDDVLKKLNLHGLDYNLIGNPETEKNISDYEN